MNSSQQPLAPAHPGGIKAGNIAGRWSIDDEIALGCECANPALQIERWHQESAAQLQEWY